MALSNAFAPITLSGVIPVNVQNASLNVNTIPLNTLGIKVYPILATASGIPPLDKIAFASAKKAEFQCVGSNGNKVFTKTDGTPATLNNVGFSTVPLTAEIGSQADIQNFSFIGTIGDSIVVTFLG